MGVRALEDRGNTEAVRHFRWHVLHRMNGDISCAGVHRDFELFDEKPFSADLLQTLVENFVTARRQRYQGNATDFRQRLQFPGDVSGLPQREFTFSRGDSDFQSFLSFFQTALHIGNMTATYKKVIDITISKHNLSAPFIVLL